MEIRKYRASDRDKLIQFWKEVFPGDPAHNDPELVIEEKLQVDDLIFLIEQDGEITAACLAGYDGHRGWLYSVGVAPLQRRRGLGKRLIEYAISQLRALGCKKVNLQIRATNLEVAAFYKALDFQPEDRLSMGRFT